MRSTERINVTMCRTGRQIAGMRSPAGIFEAIMQHTKPDTPFRFRSGSLWRSIAPPHEGCYSR
jgi:hypothetical protein